MKRGIVTFGCVWFCVRCANFSTFPLNCARSIKIDTSRSFKTQQGPSTKKTRESPKYEYEASVYMITGDDAACADIF